VLTWGTGLALIAGGMPPAHAGVVYNWSNFAGWPGGWGNADGPGATARFTDPHALAVDADGNTYVADTANHTIRKITPAGFVTTLAGRSRESGYADGTCDAARFRGPQGVAIDLAGNLYIADRGNHIIRKITPGGQVTTLAGLVLTGGSADGMGSEARFRNPSGAATDSAGNVFVADEGNSTIRRITPEGLVTTLAGLAGNSGSADGMGSEARFYGPHSIAIDGTGNLYVADNLNCTIRKITPEGLVATLAGTPMQHGSADGTGAGARFYYPQGVAADVAGCVYVADTLNSTVRRITPEGVVTTLAGLAEVRGGVDGAGSAARFRFPYGLTVDNAGRLIVADTDNHAIRKITPEEVVTTLAGLAPGSGITDGTGSAARFVAPAGLAADNAGNVYAADAGRHTIRKVTPEGVVTTLAGTPGQTGGSADGTGSAALFNSPEGVAADSAGNLYVADTANHTIRKVAPDGMVTTLVGLAGTSGSTDDVGSAARFSGPYGIAADSEGNLYVADTGNHAIRKITPDGMVTTLAGRAGSQGSTDGTGSAARFYRPCGLATDSEGNLYVADTYNHTIRKVTPAGVVTTLAGLAHAAGSADGMGRAARFWRPSDVALDVEGNVYVTDMSNCTIRKVTPAGLVTTIGGTPGVIGGAGGLGGAADFTDLRAITVDFAGNLYVADAGSNQIGKAVRRLAGDVSGDGCVDALDLLTIVLISGLVPEDPGYDVACDLNGDFVIDGDDVLILAEDFGACLE
jgi:sugar lactone lactonase YvrE